MEALGAALLLLLSLFVSFGAAVGLGLIPALAIGLVKLLAPWLLTDPEVPVLSADERRRLMAAAGWPARGPRRPVKRDLARREATLFPWGRVWRLAVPLEGVDLDGVTFLRTHVEKDSQVGDDDFDEVVSLFFDGRSSEVLHHGFRQAWMQLESLGDPWMNEGQLQVHFAPEADNPGHLLAVQDAVEAVFEALRVRPGLEGMVRSDPSPLVRRRAFDELASRGSLERALLIDVLRGPDPAMRVRARHHLDHVEGLAEDAVLVDPDELVRIYREGVASYQQVPTMLPALLTGDSVRQVEAGVRLAELVRGDTAYALGDLATGGHLDVLTPDHQRRLAAATAALLPRDALPWLAGLVARLPDHAADEALNRILELGDTELVPVLRKQAERAALVDKGRSNRIEATIRGLQADARGNIGAVSLATAVGGDLGVADPPRRPPPQRQRE